jgi:hypothetical protein
MTRTFLSALLLLACGGNALAGDGYSVAWVPDAVTAAGSDRPAALSAFDDMDASGDGAISPGRAVLYSLLLPGLGDYKAGNRGRAWVFFGVEAAIWTSFAVWRVQGSEQEDAYQDYAVRFAGLTRTGHSDDFYALVREYDSSDEYAASIKNDGRFEGYQGSDNPDLSSSALEAYFQANRIGDYEPWQWASLDNKVQYQIMRSASKNAYRRSTYAIAAAAANRVVAAIFAYTSVRNAAGDGGGQARRYHIDFTPRTRDQEASVTLIRRF